MDSDLEKEAKTCITNWKEITAEAKELHKTIDDHLSKIRVLTRNIQGGIEKTIYVGINSKDYQTISAYKEIGADLKELEECNKMIKSTIDHEKGIPTRSRKIAHFIKMGKRNFVKKDDKSSCLSDTILSTIPENQNETSEL
ncbi:hypothetical protein QKD28_gp3 [Wenling hoplichthys paramyxovirus]|uniref:Uncharacterized protein n=1 Tax=Wenling hoplichthys paramyxovirus TaxID=2116453 RepID=A0A2P1GN49_9MONO|nr:hypothetical protein QKD28_gp3 [Wenling hoplichthys paramyxovirus]AVM87394.1 hypothetical protein [Wenling hoplichthys paramyxovirus]